MNKDESNNSNLPKERSIKSNDTNDFKLGVFLMKVTRNINSQDILKELSY